jgi:hypothetical protein
VDVPLRNIIAPDIFDVILIVPYSIIGFTGVVGGFVSQLITKIERNRKRNLSIVYNFPFLITTIF